MFTVKQAQHFLGWETAQAMRLMDTDGSSVGRRRANIPWFSPVSLKMTTLNPCPQDYEFVMR
jgi:hypothetical protein